MQHLLQLGIFDDHDVAPTFVIMLIDSPTVTAEQCADLLAAGVEQYGTTPPAHAQFWACDPEPES
jgi:CTP:molybdopterin cytidylyltransferase MocA